MRGAEAFAAALKRRAEQGVVKLTIHHVLTHGKSGAVDGTLDLADGKTLAFCDVYEFGSAKGTSVKAITAYTIEIS